MATSGAPLSIQWPTLLCAQHLALFVAHQLDQLGPDDAFTRCMAELTRQHAATGNLGLKGPALLCALWSTARPRALTWDIQANRCTAPRERCSMHAKRFHIGYCATALEWADGV